ncbi:hypothetical protein PCH_Pc12g07550 [Penicillium rubens Wisconsin 54-1255]|uniref:Uncharacterized protein n=1 Tax=Penicillium rubens (strain ATCC 28089 / DSM 1075 / NRRL 1951 / Wisconsin 54-1255) TaxID=500485 RepID=B6GX27_PENRW|nr:hypothetical protein PCH_Pc12g07550 [Penicillium rubens Wisconsin 54-1255]
MSYMFIEDEGVEMPVLYSAPEQYKLVLLQAEDPFGAYVCSAEWDPDIDNMALVEKEGNGNLYTVLRIQNRRYPFMHRGLRFAFVARLRAIPTGKGGPNYLRNVDLEGNANAGRIRERTKLTLSTKMLAPDLSGLKDGKMHYTGSENVS